MKWIIAASFLSLIALPAIAQPRMGAGPSGGLTPQMFQLLDANKDGSISAEEYRAYQDRRFRGFEEPGRGQFGQDTFRQRMAMMGGSRGGNVDRDFRGYDRNRDGTVSRDEWMTWAENHFKLRDTNGDGKITAEDPAPRRDGRMDRTGNTGPGQGGGMMGGGGPGPRRPN